MRFTRPALTVLALAALAYPANASAARFLAPHRAVYDLTLDKASDRSGITGITGRMVYEFNGSACEGYTVTFRFVTRINTGDTTRTTDQQTTTFEDAEGKTFSFVTKSYVDQALEKEVRGTATREGAEVKVKLDKPEQQSLDVGTPQFPTQQLIDLMNRADRGETFYETSLYDGSEDADKSMTTTVLIGKKAEGGDKSDPEAPALASLEKDRVWPVDMAYFDETKKGGEELPQYRTSFKLHENGVTRDLTMDYGEFSITGKLVNLKLYDVKPGTCSK